MSKEVSWIEHKFSRYFKTDDGEDIHLVKEKIHYEDGSSEPNVKFIKDFERPFWVTKKHYRNHKQKKEYEEADRLDLYMSKESVLPNEIARRLGMTGYRNNNYRDVLKNPYLYGSDIPSTTIMSYMYSKKNDGKVSPYSVATFDIEANVITKEITVASSYFNKEIRVCINRNIFKFVKKMTDNEIKSKITETFKKNASDKYKDVKLIITIGTELEAITDVFKWIHSKQPDFLAIWNMAYDMVAVESRLRHYGVDPKDVVSDPSYKKEYRRYKFHEGRSKAKKADGLVINIEIQDRWHYIDVAASFYIIDAMCSYSKIRAGAQKILGGYGIDNVCSKEKVSTKMIIDNTIDPSTVSKPQWHIRMANEFPIEYIAYNCGDNTMMDDLLNKTSDLSVVLPTLADHSNFDYFSSLTKKIADKLFVTLLDDKKHKRILGTRPYIADKDDILGRDEWIITLESSRIVEEYKDIYEKEQQLS